MAFNEQPPLPSLVMEVDPSEPLLTSMGPFAFDPLDMREPGLTDHLIRVPSRSGGFLRWYPNSTFSNHQPTNALLNQSHSPSWRSELESEPEIIIETVRHHWGFLEDKGVAIAPHQIIFGHCPYTGNPALYLYSDEVTGKNLSVVGQQTAEQIVAPALYEYYKWVLDTGQPHFIRDLAHSEQWVVNNTCDGLMATLIDLDPAVVRLRGAKRKEGYETLYSDIAGSDSICVEDSDLDLCFGALAQQALKLAYPG